MNSRTKKLIGLAIGASFALELGALAYMGTDKPWKKAAPDSETPAKQDSEKTPPYGNTNTLMPEKQLQQAASTITDKLSKTVTEFKESFDDSRKK